MLGDWWKSKGDMQHVNKHWLAGDEIRSGDDFVPIVRTSWHGIKEATLQGFEQSYDMLCFVFSWNCRDAVCGIGWRGRGGSRGVWQLFWWTRWEWWQLWPQLWWRMLWGELCVVSVEGKETQIPESVGVKDIQKSRSWFQGLWLDQQWEWNGCGRGPHSRIFP